MWKHLLGDLRQIELAERTAAAFRTRYARNAEARCDEMMAVLSPKDPKRVVIRQVRKALRWLPARPQQHTER